MERLLLQKLIQWRDKTNRLPLILNGARQVGKTYLLEEFGQRFYENTVRINLEADIQARDLFEGDLNPQRILSFLETHTTQRILPDKTLLILDEIQASERALTSLKSFAEEAPQYHIAAAGSLLGVAVNREKYSFPVGKVDELTLYPLDFEEFLMALGKQQLIEQIRQHFTANEKMPNTLHEDALALWRQYLVVGGMPAVVREFIQTGSLVGLNSIQQHILNEYIADMAKYSPATTAVKIRACYNSIPQQLAKDNKKFQYKVVQRGGTATIFGESIEWLNYAGVVLKCQQVEKALVPLAAYADLSNFKLYMSDVGMLTMKAGMPASLILSPLTIDNTFMGAIAENYVAQALASKNLPLYYWRNQNTAELDFLLSENEDIVPVEVKKGTNTRAKSLNQYIITYHPKLALRISQKNFGLENNIRSVPFYAVFCL